MNDVLGVMCGTVGLVIGFIGCVFSAYNENVPVGFTSATGVAIGGITLGIYLVKSGVL